MSQTFGGENGMIAGLMAKRPVYGPNGEMFQNADAARAAGVFNFTFDPSIYGYQAPMVPQARTYEPFASDFTSQSFTMPAARGSFQPMPLRGSGLLTEAGSAVLPNNVPMYQNTWKVPDYLAPARVQAMQASAGMGGGDSFDPFSGGSNYNVSYDPNSYTGGLVASLVGQQAPVDVVRMDPNTGQVTGTDYGTFSPQGLADALSAAGYSDTGGYNDSAPDMSDFGGGYDGSDIGGFW